MAFSDNNPNQQVEEIKKNIHEYLRENGDIDLDDDQSELKDDDDAVYEDKVIEASIKSKKKLNAKEIEELTNGRTSNLSDSLLSNVMKPKQHSKLRQSYRSQF